MRLHFTSFDTEVCCDYVSVYDGDTEAAPRLAQLSGNHLGALEEAQAAASGSMLVVFDLEFSVKGDGFVAEYSCP